MIAAATALGGAQRAFQQWSADALALQAGLDAEERQAPDALAHERERHPDDLAVELGDPRARGIAVAEVADPDP